MKHILYDNYNLSDGFDELKQDMLDELGEVTDEEVWEELHSNSILDWDWTLNDIVRAFDGNTAIAVGTIGKWNGSAAGGKVDSVRNLINSLMTDCEYAKIEDIDGHLYITCSHHDGTNHMEIKMLTEKGAEKYDKWNYDWNNRRSMKEEHQVLFNTNFYSALPRVWEKCYSR